MNTNHPGKKYQLYFAYGCGVCDIREAPKGAGDTFTGNDIVDRLAELAKLDGELNQMAELAMDADARGNLPIGMGGILFARMEKIRAGRRKDALDEIKVLIDVDSEGVTA